MQVYIELALAENFCMDFFLLYSAKLISKNTCGVLKVALSSLFGAVFAVIVPLFNLNAYLSVIFKIACGILLAAFAGNFKSIKKFLIFTLIFFALAFALGGGLLAIFWLAGIDYVQGEGYLISSVPVGIPLFCGLVLTLFCKKFAAKIRARCTKNTLKLCAYVGDKCANISAFYDSGNSVYYLGQPVCIVPYDFAKQLVEVERIKASTYVHTVAGRQKIAIFTADKITIECDGKVKLLYKVRLGVSSRPIKQAVLHPDLAEVN
jgi:stage II sporulation protein GA (sporulation sigma-E factor processing peptidase)